MYVCVQGCLYKLKEDITKTLEKVGSREKYLNTQLEHLISEYRQAQAQLNKVNFSPIKTQITYGQMDFWIVFLWFRWRSFINRQVEVWQREPEFWLRLVWKQHHRKSHVILHKTQHDT